MQRAAIWGVAALFAGAMAAAAAEATKPEPVRMSLAQARRTVTMLNDLYVSSVVQTHGTYVKDAKATPATAVARRVFQSMEAKGWPSTRWLSTTSRPLNPDAAPKDDFEREAVEALKNGKPRYERVEAGKLRLAMLVTLSEESCRMCHTQVRVKDPVGGLSYTVPLNGK